MISSNNSSYWCPQYFVAWFVYPTILLKFSLNVVNNEVRQRIVLAFCLVFSALISCCAHHQEEGTRKERTDSSLSVIVDTAEVQILCLPTVIE